MHLPNEDVCPVDRLRPYANNARTHSRKQLKQIADSIKRFGFTNPVLVDDSGMIVAGHGRVEAAKMIGMDEVPIRRLSHLSDDEIRAYVLADNKLAENAGWDADILALELQGLIDLDFDVELTGFAMAEIDLILDGEHSPANDPDPMLDRVEQPGDGPTVTRHGDLWLLGDHRLLCGDARSTDDVDKLCAGETMSLLITDPPYNVPIDGHVGGLGQIKHREFVAGSGEMSSDQFTDFLRQTLHSAASPLKQGAIAFVFMDWRHMREVLDAGEAVFNELKNLCVWNKTNGGMGSFYRSKHELVFVFKKGSAPHTNNFGLGEDGRYRTNVWDYPGISSLGASRSEQLSMHPTVKPVAMIADAIRDCSKRGDYVLDVFGGSGTTLIAAGQCGRKAHLLELDPAYCDTIIKRFERISGKKAALAETGEGFSQVQQARSNGLDENPTTSHLEQPNECVTVGQASEKAPVTSTINKRAEIGQ